MTDGGLTLWILGLVLLWGYAELDEWMEKRKIARGNGRSQSKQVHR